MKICIVLPQHSILIFLVYSSKRGKRLSVTGGFPFLPSTFKVEGTKQSYLSCSRPFLTLRCHIAL